jgi:peptidoglycan/xylan/chitin deacetylase (PgdA/CDA1 family)
VKITPTKTPLIVKKLFPDYFWEISTNKKELYLTFDDGPTPDITNWVLETLKPFNAKATFFCIGDNIKKHPEIFSQIVNEEHSIGNHTHNHIKGWNTETKQYLENVAIAEEVIASQIFQPSNVNLFRPPYGQIKPKQGKKLMALGYKIVMWDVLSFDWDKTVSNQECLNHVISKSKNGSIVVFHDSIKASYNMKFALPKVLEHFTEKGFSFKAISSIDILE